MKPRLRDWLETINFLQESAITPLSNGSNGSELQHLQVLQHVMCSSVQMKITLTTFCKVLLRGSSGHILLFEACI
uniref:Uncharacterized protein n=1 Tax=Timema cristinae TaxID=61476 RepID=A0A7R9H6U0_TIMCR|nr:unnamed protein product [Timema cristinae]